MTILQIILIVAATWCGLAVLVCALWAWFRKPERDHQARHPEEREPQ